MDYIDLDGKLKKNTTGQDNLLDFLYNNFVGRLLLKPLVCPNVSKLSGKLLSTRLSSLLVKPFIKKNNIDLSDYECNKFSSFNDFFTRKIRAGKRPFPADTKTLISPCDCKASVYPIQDDTTFSIKHTEYTLRSLLRSRKLAKRFQGGTLFLLRLTVDDYHRYNYAVSGFKTKNYHIPGSFHTVNPVANDFLPIYKENTREYTIIHTPGFGDILQMEVGALMVGKISNHTHQKSFVTRGTEKGFFEYGGSTIIVITEKDKAFAREDLIQNTSLGYETKILQGQPIGSLCE